ncbi:MAG: EAL domain-containing protein [Sphingobium sp.]|nr:EAL domain-containing protein [Sphingobium sp.]MCI1272299.1 EAL domain-containing protein [Sphingobium sp.]MCI1756657.1 EAL domain-containing protein [Sphingobium sp.]MCI2052920.1 EAL domain-containing protein [Sphingobium sp.]
MPTAFGEAATPSASHPPAEFLSFMNGLPNAAAIIGWSEGAPFFQIWNSEFARKFPPMVDRAEANSEQWIAHIRAEIIAFVLSGAPQRRFEVERMSPLGIEAFDCTLALIDDPCVGGQRVLLNALDRTADRRVEESLRRELVSDSLTALPNRVGFGELMEETIARHAHDTSTQLGVLIVDLMRFGRVNEALGSMAGDELILSIAARLNGCIGKDAVIARIGGNDFGIFVEARSGISDVITLAERVQAILSAPIRLSNLTISVNCAIGCSLSPIKDADPDELVRQAQAASRIAKNSGRVEIYRAGELGAARQRFFLESRLRDALARDGLTLSYQPIIELASGGVIGFEALARWQDQDLGVVSPADFIPVAEESGLIVQLGRWAVHEALHQMACWDVRHGAEVPLKVSVNLSSIQIARDDVAAMVADALELNAMHGSRLTIELTESALVDDPVKCRALLETFKRADIAVAMDDFGTGFSNLASLQSLPLDVLKMDRSFVTDMLIDTDKLAIIRAILSLAQTLGMKTTAEGIEDADAAAALRDMGCTYGQGYYFAKPLSADDAYEFWRSRSNLAT